MTGIHDAMRRLDSLIDRVGWAVMHILPTDDDPDTVAFFSYTVGLTAHSHPELLIAGLDPQASQELLNDLARRVYDTATRFTHGQHLTDLLDGYEAVIVEGPATDDLRPGAAFTRYGHSGCECSRSSGPTRPAASHGSRATPSHRTSSR